MLPVQGHQSLQEWRGCSFRDCLNFPAAYMQPFADMFTLSEAHFRVLDLRTSIIILCAKLTEQ